MAEHSLLVEFADDFGAEAHEAVLALDRALASARIDGLLEVVPALVNLLIRFDPIVTDHEQVSAAVGDALSRQSRQPVNSGHHVVQVCYHESVAPDLGEVANACGVSVPEVVEAHRSALYRVLMYGFAPGYAYLDGLPPGLRLPRKPVPVRDVPAGSVVIAGPQCLVTTLDMPTGWWVIGRSPTAILDPKADQPYLFELGDSVEFREISRSDLRP